MSIPLREIYLPSLDIRLFSETESFLDANVFFQGTSGCLFLEIDDQQIFETSVLRGKIVSKSEFSK